MAKPFLVRSQATKVLILDDAAEIHIRKLTAGEVETMQRKYSKEDKALEGLRFIVARCVVDETGAQVYSDTDIVELANADYSIIQQIATAALEFSGLNTQKKD